MVEIKLSSGVKFVAEVKKGVKCAGNGGEVILQYFVDNRGKVVKDRVTCYCSCGDGSSDSKACTKEESLNAHCDCTGSAKVSC